MQLEFSGIERRLDELSERLARLESLRERSRAEFDADPLLRDIAERNLEITAQCCIDISHRIISLEKAVKPRDYHEAILRLGELSVLPPSLAGLRNILIHEYVSIDWDEVYTNLRNLDDIVRFSDLVRRWLGSRLRDAQH